MGDKVKDFVCGMEFYKNTASALFEYKGKIYYFCSLGCRDEFAKDPDKYVAHEEK